MFSSHDCIFWLQIVTSVVSEVYFYQFKTERQEYNIFFWIPERNIIIAKALPSVAHFTEGYDQANN